MRPSQSFQWPMSTSLAQPIKAGSCFPCNFGRFGLQLRQVFGHRHLETRAGFSDPSQQRSLGLSPRVIRCEDGGFARNRLDMASNEKAAWA